MDMNGAIIATLGALLLLGLAGDLLSHKLPLPRVTLLVLFGVLCGPAGFGLLPVDAEAMYPLISNIALLMVGFLLGGKLSRETLRETGRHVMWISAFEVVGTAACVLFGLLALGVAPVLAMILAGIAPASAPAAVKNVVDELRARGKFTDTLLGVVAIDDAWGLIVFSILLAIAQVVAGNGGGLYALEHGAYDLGGALVLGVLLGVPAAYGTGRLRPGEPMQAEALGVVLFAGGLAIWLEVSFLLTAMIIGAVVVNLATHHDRPFQEIEHVEWPFMVLFFVLAGASLEIRQLGTIGWIGLAYMALRTAGLVAGAFIGARIAKAPPAISHWMGAAILPQAGVALGMALVAGNAFPELQSTILPIVIGATVVFELLGPLFTRWALIRAGERRPLAARTETS